MLNTGLLYWFTRPRNMQETKTIELVSFLLTQINMYKHILNQATLISILSLWFWRENLLWIVKNFTLVHHYQSNSAWRVRITFNIINVAGGNLLNAKLHSNPLDRTMLCSKVKDLEKSIW